MELYALRGSNNVRKVAAVIGHLGLDVTVRWLDFGRAEHRQPAYLALNPNGKVPTLVDGDFVLWESNAIARYLQSFGVLAWETVAKPVFLKQEPDPALVAWSSRALATHAAVLDRHLEGRSHAVGAGVTLADYALVHVDQFKDKVPFDWSRFPSLDAYYARMAADPHWAATAVAPDRLGRGD
jgi:glutathione S-transferase